MIKLRAMSIYDRENKYPKTEIKTAFNILKELASGLLGKQKGGAGRGAHTVRSDRWGTWQVNLVSEHIWCEDFLVRSFYLKNVQTQETRTLTQFHFLSWPAEGTPASTRPLLDFRR